MSHIAPAPEATFKRLFDLLHEELRAIARQRLRREGRIQTLDSVALVAETYLRLYRRFASDVMGEAAFKALCSQAMKCILIDYYRRHHRRYDALPVSHSELAGAGDGLTVTLDLALLLEELERADPEKAWVTNCRFFGGMTYAEIAEASAETPAVPGLTAKQVEKRWGAVKKWLLHRLGEPPPDSGTA